MNERVLRFTSCLEFGEEGPQWASDDEPLWVLVHGEGNFLFILGGTTSCRHIGFLVEGLGIHDRDEFTEPPESEWPDEVCAAVMKYRLMGAWNG